MRGYLTGRAVMGRTIICAVLMVGLFGVVILATLLTTSLPTSAQSGTSTWAKTYPGERAGYHDGYGKGILRMPDGDLVATGNLGGPLLIARLSSEGNVRWSKTYNTEYSGGHDSSSTAPGISCSPSGMLVCYESTLIRLNDSGTVRWARNYTIYTPSWTDVEFTDVVQVADGGFVACGEASAAGQGDVFVCRLDRSGTPVWTKSYSLGSGRPRVFSLAGGGLLLGGTVPEGELGGANGAKLMWLDADGRVQRSLAYVDTTTYSSGYAYRTNIGMTPSGPVLCLAHYSGPQPRFAGRQDGTNVVKLDPTGAVQWTTWITGLEEYTIAPFSLYGIDAAADGSLVIVGSVGEYAGRDAWDPGVDGIAARLSPEGDVLWVSTVDREVWMSWLQDEAVVAMDDGGLAWAGTSMRGVTGDWNWDLFVVRMGPDGTAGKLGNYLTQVDIGNADQVRIEHPAVTSQPARRDSEPARCEFEDADVTPEDTILTGSEVEGEGPLTLRPLYPASPSTPSTIMQGGTMYRYYRVLDDEGKPLAGAELRYHDPFSSKTLTATSDASGEIALSFSVPLSTEPQHLDSTLSIDRVRVNGVRNVLTAVPDFATDVLPLSWSTNWMLGNGVAGKGGLGLGGGVFGALELTGGMVVTRTAADPANDGKGSLAINDSMSNEASIGVQGEAGSFHLGPVRVKAVDASSKVSLGTFIDFATLFNEPSECTTAQKLMAALTLLFGVGNSVAGGQTTLLSVAEGAIVSALSSDVDMEHLTGGVSIGTSSEVSGLALDLFKADPASGGKESTDTEDEKGTSLSGVSLGKLGIGERALLSITAYPGAGEASGKAAVELSATASFLEAFGYQVKGYSGADGASAELVVDPLGTSFERLVLVASTEGNGAQETRLTIDRSVVGVAANAILAQVLPLAPVLTSSVDQRMFFSKEFCGQVLQNVVKAVAAVTVPYEQVVTKDKSPTSLDVGLGLSIGGTGVDLSVKPTWGRYQSYPVERGLFVALDDQLRIGRMVKLEEYPASLFSPQVDTLPNVIGELLKAVGELLVDVWDLATGALSSTKDTLLEVGAGAGGAIGGGASALFQQGTSILTSPLGAVGGVQLALLNPRTSSDTGPAPAASSTKKVTLVGAPSDGAGFSVGGVYILEPENGTLSKPATLTLSYSAEAVVERDPAPFSIYHYDAVGRVWTPVGSTHDRVARTLTATITETGGYCIGSDGDGPEFALLLPSETPAVVTTSKPQLTVGCTEEGSGLDPATFKATLDGRPLEAEWSPAAGCSVLTAVDSLAAGTHTLTVEGSDGNGNQGSATFAVEVRLPPGQAVLRLRGATSERVDLGLEARQGDVPPAAYDIWRTDPGPGVSYRRLATVTPDSGTYSDSDVLPGETYRYVAVTRSGEDVEGPLSEPLTVTVLEGSSSETTEVPTTGTTSAAERTETTAGPGSTETTARTESDRDGLSRGTWAGIIVGAVVAAALVVGGVLGVRRRHR